MWLIWLIPSVCVSVPSLACRVHTHRTNSLVLCVCIQDADTSKTCVCGLPQLRNIGARSCVCALTFAMHRRRDPGKYARSRARTKGVRLRGFVWRHRDSHLRHSCARTGRAINVAGLWSRISSAGMTRAGTHDLSVCIKPKVHSNRHITTTRTLKGDTTSKHSIPSSKRHTSYHSIYFWITRITSSVVSHNLCANNLHCVCCVGVIEQHHRIYYWSIHTHTHLIQNTRYIYNNIRYYMSRTRLLRRRRRRCVSFLVISESVLSA